MHDDLKGTMEGIKERLVQEAARRRTMVEQEEKVRVEQERRRAERERRRASRPPRDPAMSRYADMIENRVREGERTSQGSEGPQRGLQGGCLESTVNSSGQVLVGRVRSKTVRDRNIVRG